MVLSLSYVIDQTLWHLNTKEVKTSARSGSASKFLSVLLSSILFVVLLSPAISHAAMTLTTTEDGIQVYSGPSERFRILATLPAKTEIKASATIVSGSSGRFYRVIVQLGEKQRAIGFIPVNAPIRVGGEDQDEDELSKYGAVSLISRAVQMTYSLFRDKQAFYSLGYMHYLSPGFYVKGAVGQWTTPVASGTMAGGEIGNDSLLVGPVSGFVSYGLGLFKPSAEGAIFAGSTSFNIMMNATVGIRYNLEGFASFAIAGQQAAIYNANNSLLSTGIQMSLEVGL